MKIKEAYIKGKRILEESLIEDIDIKTRLLMCYVLNIKKEELVIKQDEQMSSENEEAFFDGISKLKEETPIQYITHKQEFMKLDFYVDENVLIPQPDTEVLVEETLKLAKSTSNIDKIDEASDIETIFSTKIKILDLCTGSGAIAVSIAKYLQNADVYASDISTSALSVAKRNTDSNNVMVKFIESDLFENIHETKFDIIVSNPPYIENAVIETLSNEVKHEPILALAGGDDGLDFYRKIANEAKNYLKQDGYLCLEIGYNQEISVKEILEKQGYSDVICVNDLAGNARVIIARN